MTPAILEIPRWCSQATAGLITVPMTIAINKIKTTWLNR